MQIKKTIIRLYEFENKRTNCKLEFMRELEQVYECDMLENNEKKLVSNNKEFSFIIKPYEIKTFKVQLK